MSSLNLTCLLFRFAAAREQMLDSLSKSHPVTVGSAVWSAVTRNLNPIEIHPESGGVTPNELAHVREPPSEAAGAAESHYSFFARLFLTFSVDR